MSCQKLTINQAREEFRSRLGTALLLTTALLATGCVSTPTQHPSVTYRDVDTHVTEEVRESIKLVAIRPSEFRPDLYIEGDYQKDVPTPGEGARAGAGAGAQLTGQMIAEDARALILAPIILPVAMIVGSVGGAAAAKIRQEIQEFRDELTAELTTESNPPLGGDILAEALRTQLEKSHDFEATLISHDDPVSPDIDALVDMRVKDLTIVVEGNDAIMITSAVADLRLTDSNRVVYHKTLSFSEKNTLSNWVKDENALWTDYVHRARRHFTRAISSDFFEEIRLRHVLRPIGNEVTRYDSASSPWKAVTKASAPTFSWELILLGDDAYGAWTENIDASAATYELEVYNGGDLVYSAQNIAAPYHQAATELEGCGTYSWSVRPHYQIDGRTRTGEWMNYARRSNGFSRSGTPETPDFWKDFPKLEIRC
jgi:hypothetical protein